MVAPSYRSIRSKIAANDYILDHPYGYVGVGYGMKKKHHRGSKGHRKHCLSSTGRARLSSAARSRARTASGKFK